MSINRRELAKGIAAGLAAGGISPYSAAEDQQEKALAWTAAYPGIWRARLGVPEAHTPVSMRHIPVAVERLAHLPAVAAPPIIGLEGAITRRGCRLALPLEPSESIYGFGLQLLSLQQRGKKRIIRVNADPKGDCGDSHAPAPFYVTTRGYGILVDTLRHAEFYCGEAHPAPSRAAKAGAGAINTPQEVKESERTALSKVLVEVPRAKGVDVYLFAGPTMLNAVQRYNLFSGGGVAPPEWGLGFWYRPEMHLDQDAVLALAREFRDHQIPCDVLGLEPGWQSHAYSCSFAWDSARFPKPDEFLRAAAAQDFRINLWEHAFTHPTSPIFDALIPYAGDFAVWGGLVPDFAEERAREIFGGYHGKQLVDAGVSGFKLDECDNSDYTEGWSFPDMSRFGSGLDGEQMHAIFGLDYQETIWKQFRDRGRDTYCLVRSSGPLAAPYPFALYSDLYEHRQFVRGILTAGFSGLLWCPEVRDAVSQEDLIRRLQTAVFSPLAMVNAWYIRNPPWKQLNRELNNNGTLAENWHELEAQCREIIGWRMRLIPYLLSTFHRYVYDGTPPFRALVLDHPEDAGVQTADDEYMIGDRMLVAPLFAGEAKRTIVLPAGEWHDFWTGKRIEGVQIEAAASTEKIPVFVRSGSIIPLAAVGASTASEESRKLMVQVYGDGHLGWQLNPAAPGDLQFTWNAPEQRGGVQQTSSGRPYQVIGWRQLGV